MLTYNDQNLPLQSGCFYHIYNRGNNGQHIFYQQDNYRYFLKKFSEYMSDYVDVYAYCLLKNHFHWLIRVKDESVLFPQVQKDFPQGFNNMPYKINRIDEIDMQELVKYYPHWVSLVVSERLRRMFLGYAKAICKQEKLKGSLFQKFYRRKHVNSDAYFTQLIAYIHRNPVKHHYTTDFKTYYWSSYHRILQDHSTKLHKQAVLDWFGGKDSFQLFHQELIDENLIKDLIIEDDND